MNKITSVSFLQAFQEEWTHQRKTNPFDIKRFYPDCIAWTKYILNHGGFLSRVLDRLDANRDLQYKREYYTLDGLFVGGKDLLGSNRSYPSELHVLIEHENGDRVEEEMWKLIFWRAPLKVLIFYDWNQHDKVNKDTEDWLLEKQQKLIDMLNAANSFFKENTSTEYLFIVGNRLSPDALPSWRYATEKELRFIPIE